MPNSPTEKLPPELVERVKASAVSFFPLQPKKQFFAHFVRSNENGELVFVLMTRDGKVAPFTYAGSSSKSSASDLVRLLNETHQGQAFLKLKSNEVFDRM
jgi:hypothetical protein